jgi:hexosaminidase
VQAAAHYFGDLLSQSHGWRPEIVQGSAEEAPKRSIVFRIENDGSPAEGYRLEVASKNITAVSSDPRGLLYAAVTLWQLSTHSPTAEAEIRIPGVSITDAPRLRWRGLMLDSARQYQSVTFIKRYIDLMALHKLNVLHWHLVDDQAWRLQIPKYPKLTNGISSYSSTDVREVVEYATSRNVTVVPGLEMPGHAASAIVAYPALGASDSPPKLGTDSLFNVEDSTFAFLDEVFAYAATLFPSEYVHIGAMDISKDQWVRSTSAQARMRELGIINEQRLQRYFFERITASLDKQGKRLTGWDGIMGGGVAQNAVVMTARGLDGALGAAASGYDVVVSSNDSLSFNRRQQAVGNGDTPETGGMISLADVYNFDPAPVALSAQDRSRLIGVQANLWTAAVDGEDMIETLTYPRAAALAEVGWSQPVRRRWQDFQQRMVSQMNRYAKLGIHYSDAAFRVMAFERGNTGARVAIELAKQVPLGEIRYTLNGSEPTAKSSVYTDVFDVPRPATVKAAVFYNGEALARAVTLEVSR